MTRLLSTIATDHIDVESAFDWGTTDATPAMQNSVRSVTLMGFKRRTDSHLAAPPLMSARTLTLVSADAAVLVTELIRRS